MSRRSDRCRSSSRFWRRCTRAGAPRASIPQRRCAMSSAQMNGAVVACSGLQKTYQGPASVPVLLGVELAVQPGEHIAIMGKSGSGKSTLLHLLGGLDAPTAGQVFVNGRELSAMDEAERGRVRN